MEIGSQFLERRHDRRFPVHGSAEFQARESQATGELLVVSNGGLLIRSVCCPALYAEIAVRFSVNDYRERLSGIGKVMRKQPGLFAIVFVKQPNRIRELLDWLQAQETSAKH
ncbi:MAG: PilZ domain-containing protein [Acidobacteria bacterium]|nr:PilZ domain-containing protein [Acidobacteriota bacterium]